MIAIKRSRRLMAFVLAFAMAITSMPIGAMATIDEPVNDTIGTGWDAIDGNNTSPDPVPSEENNTTTPENTEKPFENENITEEVPVPDDHSNSENTETPKEEKTELNSEPMGTLLPWAANLDEAMEATASTPVLFASNSARFSDLTYRKEHFGSTPDDYIWIGEKGPKGYYFGFVDIISYKGKDAFCGEFNGKTPGGSYDEGTPGTSRKIKEIIACYEASSKSPADYIAAQALIWASILGKNVTNWGASEANENLLDISANANDVTYTVKQNLDSPHTQNIIVYDLGGNVAEPYALKILKKNEDGTELISGATFKVEGPNGFERHDLKTNSRGEIIVGLPTTGKFTVTETKPAAGFKICDPNYQTVIITKSNTPANPAIFEFRNEKDDTPPTEDGNIKVETEEETETKVENSKEYEYSDAIGQITIRKHDQDGRSLDGALFNILVEFTDGTSLLEENWEVDNGARLFTWTHPTDNHDPAKVTITEVQPPLHYKGDSEPKTVTVSPTFTRVTHVTSWTITITTTTTNVTIIGDDGEVIEENSSTATATTKSEPQVEEFTDFIAGDREITVTFVNERITGDIIVTKKDGNTGVPLAGAHIHLWGEDLGHPNHIDKTLVTDENGEAVFNELPPGTYAIQETQAPFSYNLNSEIQNAVLESNQVVRKEIRNYRKDGLTIKKVDQDGNPLPGATFELRRGSGEVLLRDVTNENGIIWRGHLTDDTYVVEEIAPPDGFLIDENPIQDIRIYATDDNKEYTLTFVNKKKPSIEVTKVDGLNTNVKLEGAVFRITDTRTNNYWDITTGEDGKALLENLEINTTYNVQELKSPEGYLNSNYNKDIVLKECRKHTIVVENFENPGIKIIKKDKETGEPLEGATFRISWESGSQFRDVTTGEDGTVLVTGLNEGWYTVVEIEPPLNHLIDSTPHQVLLSQGKVSTLEIFNEAKPSIIIKKTDSITNAPLSGAEFKIELKTLNGVKLIAKHTTDENGEIELLDIVPGIYLITEERCPDGYISDNKTHEILVDHSKTYTVNVTNTPKSPIVIFKTDENGTPLAGAKFVVKTINGSPVKTVTTGITGHATIPYAEPGWYIVEEVASAPGFILDSTPQNVEVKAGRPAEVHFVNYAKPELTILKIDADSRKPLMGAKFKVSKSTGELIGYYTTDNNGLIVLDNLDVSSVIVTEISAPDGYIVNMTPHIVNLDHGESVSLEIENTAKPGLQVLKTDKLTGLPISDVRFSVTYLQNGGKKEIGTFTTSENGTFFIPNLEPGHYVITEIQAAPNYILDATPKNIEIEGGKLNHVEFFNTPYSDLRILKIDSETREPLPGAVFKIYDEHRLEIGTYTSNELGEILVTGLPSGEVFLQEQKAPLGFILDNTVKRVELLGGKTTTVEIKNTSLGSLRIKKVDSKTNEPLYGAVFNLYDSRNNLLGEYTTDQNGMITFGTSLRSGTYKLKETHAPLDHVLDETVRTIKVKSDETTEVVIPNDPMTGNIQIVKITNDNNTITGDKKGDSLSGAVFEIFDSNLNLVDKIETDSNGIATSKDLPLGKYAVREVCAPQHYQKLDKTMYAEIKVHNDLVRFKVENTPVKLDVSIEKRGPAETMSGEYINYTLSNIANNSNCSLEDFYWRDTIPSEAIRVISMKTGTYNKTGNYDVYVRTNKHSWKCIEDNLSTRVDHEIDLSNRALGLSSNEYITEVKLEFGRVDAGFKSVSDPLITAKARLSLPKGYRIANNADVGGSCEDKWIYNKDRWITVIYKETDKKLPQTGGSLFFQMYPEYLGR